MPLPSLPASTASCPDAQRCLPRSASPERVCIPKEAASLQSRIQQRCHLCDLEQLPSLAVGHLMKPNADSIALGAHRGMGMNDVQRGQAGWRENTIKSFLKAADHGASFIEFDVQVTQDGIPIVWHDDWITYGNAHAQHSAKIRDLTFEEFRSIGHRAAREAHLPRHALYRSAPAGRMQEWTCQDEDELPSLEQVFQLMPDHVAFNIELKMTSDPDQEATPDAELEFVTTAVVSVVKRFSKDRTIVFSSFDPDLTQKIKRAQPHATMFLSSGEGEVHVDPRRTSYFAAVEWAHSNGLDGIVLHSNDLRHRQNIITEAAARGLLVMTFGSDNDDYEWIIAQFCLGVHGAIVDDVAGIARQLSQGILDFI